MRILCVFRVYFEIGGVIIPLLRDTEAISEPLFVFLLYFFIGSFSLVQSFMFWIVRRVLHAVAVGRAFCTIFVLP